MDCTSQSELPRPVPPVGLRWYSDSPDEWSLSEIGRQTRSGKKPTDNTGSVFVARHYEIYSSVTKLVPR